MKQKQKAVFAAARRTISIAAEAATLLPYAKRRTTALPVLISMRSVQFDNLHLYQERKGKMALPEAFHSGILIYYTGMRRLLQSGFNRNQIYF
ncbi:MAG: hypothetical protein LIO46_05035 [Clostridiales bacterium]|nr:hypothetical protein [Clostridiales bacterium]